MEVTRHRDFQFKGLHGFPSKCSWEVHEGNGRATVIFTELDDNPGTSITNFFEHLATMVYNLYLKRYPAEAIRWIEHYPERRRGRKVEEETLDEVTLTWDGKKFSSPKWRRIQQCQL
jgi:hypothetical protein